MQVFNVTGRLHLVVQVDVKAASFEDALTISKSLKEQDFVTFAGDFMDGRLQIVGVQMNNAWDLERKIDGKS